MVFVKKLRFFPSFFFTKMDKGIIFCEVVGRRQAVLSYKNIGLTNPLNLHFDKGDSPPFCPKMKMFFFLCKMDQQKVFSDVFESK